MAESHRQILRSSSIIGGASIVNILIALLRTKAVAILLGPAGIGLIGLFQNVMVTASTVSSLGVGTVGTRQIAEAKEQGEPETIAATRRALVRGTLPLAVAGAIVFWLLRGVIATWLVGDAGFTNEIGWLALGVGLLVATKAQRALLNGLRRIGDLARVSVFSALLSTVLGIGALLLWHERGLIAFVIAAPLASFLLGQIFVARLRKPRAPATPLSKLVEHWRILVRLGTAFMLAGAAVTAGELAVRTMVQQMLGPVALGQFQAAWIIAMTYVGFVLAAMGTDYYPRLTAAMRVPASANRLVNEQSEVALLLAGPVLILMLGLAPWVIELLYSSQFSGAAVVLRWQMLGDVAKIASWPLGFVILAAGEGRTFMLTEALGVVVFAGLTWLGLPLLGIQAAGVAYLGMYAAYLPLVYWLAHRRTKFQWTAAVLKLWLTLFVAAVSVFALATWSPWAGVAAGILIALAFGVYSAVRLAGMTGLTGSPGKIAARMRTLLIKLGIGRE